MNNIDLFETLIKIRNKVKATYCSIMNKTNNNEITLTVYDKNTAYILISYITLNYPELHIDKIENKIEEDKVEKNKLINKTIIYFNIDKEYVTNKE